MQPTNGFISIVKSGGLNLLYWPNYLDAERAVTLLQFLLQIPYNTDEQSKVRIFNKTYVIARKQVAFADPNTVPYKFSGTAIAGSDWPPVLAALKTELNELLRDSENISGFNFCLVNHYRNNLDHIGPHADAETDLQPSVSGHHIIVSISLGAARSFVFSRKKSPNIEHRMTLNSGDLLIMRGLTNKNWKHALPALKKECGRRISLTFRCMRTIEE